MIKKIFFDVTNRCNAQCIYCFTDSINHKNEIKNELTNFQILRLIDEAHYLKISSISIGGGEPFLKDIPFIGNYANGKVKLSITTNGTILNNRILDYMLNSDTKLTISLDAIDKIISERVRKGIDIDKCLKNIVTLSRYTELLPRLSIRSVISVYNYKHIFEVIKFCNENRIKNLKINSTNYFGRAKSNPNVILPFDDFIKLLDEVKDYCQKERIYTNVELPISKYLTDSNSCLCGNTSVYIDSVGNVYPCAFTEGQLYWGNLKTSTLENILDTHSNFDHNNDFCSNCPVNRYKNYNKNFSTYDQIK